MCLINCNIVEVENKEEKRNSDITYEERVKIEYMIKKKYTMQEMGEELGRNKSTISREIKRHSEEKWNYSTGICKKVYSAAVAQGKYEYSKKKAGRKCKLSRVLKEYIEEKILIEKWSPEEVAGYIRVNDIKFDIQPSFQLIYYWIENKKLNIKPIDLVHKAKLGKKKKAKEKEERPARDPEKSIHNRPKEIDENKEFGHWEIDCVEGNKDSSKTYMTLLERFTKKYIVIEMKAHTNECIKQAIDSLEDKYGSKFKKIFKSMTTDNGHEFLNYDKIEKSKYREEKRTTVYYADPYSSWQKGMNENCNGILRRFIPKGTDLSKVSREKLEKILVKINGKPRKILGFISADKRFNEEINKIVT